MKKEILSKFRHKHGIYMKEKQGWVTWDEYRDMVRGCRKCNEEDKDPPGIQSGEEYQGSQAGFLQIEL